MAVYEQRLKEIVDCKKVNINKQSVFTSEEKDKIIGYWAKYKSGRYFNSVNISVEDITDRGNASEVVLSKTDFYSLLISNIIRTQEIAFVEYLQEVIEHEEAYLIKKMQNYYASIPKVNNLHDLLVSGNMANALAISVLVRDKYDNIMLVKRTNNVAIGKNLYSVTATGAIDLNDWEAPNPIVNCAIRELHEELGLCVKVEQIKIKSIVAGCNKMQPIAILDAYVDFNLKDIDCSENSAEDFELEIEKVYVVHRNDINMILEECNFTEAAEYHLHSVM